MWVVGVSNRPPTSPFLAWWFFLSLAHLYLLLSLCTCFPSALVGKCEREIKEDKKLTPQQPPLPSQLECLPSLLNGSMGSF
jgi:hypothetical protein